MFRRDKLVSRTLSVLLSAIVAAPAALADPPAHAPAHGWRAKQAQPYYVGYDGRHWSRDYGVREGRCDRDEIGAVLGAVAGGAIGSTVAQGDERIVAILAGAVIGSVIGHEIGRQIDNSDRGCIGHTLELGQAGQPVRWQDADPRLAWSFTPYESYQRDGRDCRRYQLVRSYDGRNESQRGVACRDDHGAWHLDG
ncbi:MAG TPA: glycine zipper 2TM domain-containing protein [Steroidobacteraceae bacterium]|nr:glycine zipper 2TM domain-containing protein [Steroidobacteraceae bacterium]